MPEAILGSLFMQHFDATTYALIFGVIGLICYVIYRAQSSAGRNESFRARRPAGESSSPTLEEEAREAAEFASRAAVEAYTRQQTELSQRQAEARRVSAEKSRVTKAQKIASLEPWREDFVELVYGLGVPYFTKWNINNDQIIAWADQRASAYIKKKPYVLELIKDLQIDAQRSAESLANKSLKSNREIARERSPGNAPSWNRDCPYCGVELDDKAHLDHIHPVQRGGPSEAWNLVYVCKYCNHAKRDKSLAEFAVSDYAKNNNISLSIISSRLKLLDKMVNV